MNGGHIFISCGEASGDRYGAALLAALREERPQLRFSALGGSALAMAGAEVVQASEEIAVMGFGEVLASLPAILRARRRVWRHLDRGGVDLVVPIDFPGFNLQVAGRAHRRGVPVFYLVPPQLWAWGAWRLGQLRRRVDRIGAILPFEPEFFGQRGLDVVHVGHPLMEDYADFPFEESWRRREAVLASADRPVTVGLLPGSRRQEIVRLLPQMKVAAAMIQSWLGTRRIEILVSAAPGTDRKLLASLVGPQARLVDDPLPALLPRLDLALVCSGTACLETALAGVPHALAYRTSGFNYAVARRLVRVPYVGLPNLVLGQPLVPEHLQDDASPAQLARSLLEFVNQPGRREAFHAGCRELRTRCGGPGMWRRTAQAVLALLDSRRPGA